MRHIWVLGLVLASPVQDSCRHTRTSPALGHKDHEGTGASLIRGEPERTRTVQPGGKKVQGHFIHVYKHLMGQKEQKGVTLPSEVPNDRGRANAHKLKTRKFHPDTKKHLLGWWANTEMGLPKRLWSLHLFMTGSCRNQRATVDPTWAGDWTSWIL